MIRNKAQVQDYLLKKLRGESKEIMAAALVSDDGLAIVSTVSDTARQEKLAAVASAVFRPSKKCSAELGFDGLGFAIVSGKKYSLYVKEVGTGQALAVLIRSGADWPALQKQLQKAASDLQYIAEMKGKIDEKLRPK